MDSLFFICSSENNRYICKKGGKSEISVVQSISVGESSFFLLYIVLAASSRRPKGVFVDACEGRGDIADFS